MALDTVDIQEASRECRVCHFGSRPYIMRMCGVEPKAQPCFSQTCVLELIVSASTCDRVGSGSTSRAGFVLHGAAFSWFGLSLTEVAEYERGSHSVTSDVSEHRTDSFMLSFFMSSDLSGFPLSISLSEL